MRTQETETEADVDRLTEEERALVEKNRGLIGKAIARIRTSERGRLLIDALGYYDAFSQGVLHVCRVIRRYDPALGALSTFIVTAVTRHLVAQGEKALNWKKFAITESVLCARDDDRQALERHPDDASDTLTLERQENVALILAAVRRLHAVHRQLLEWLIAGKNSRSYAQAHGLTHQRVNQRLTKARAALRRELNNAHVWASHLVVDETRTV